MHKHYVVGLKGQKPSCRSAFYFSKFYKVYLQEIYIFKISSLGKTTRNMKLTKHQIQSMFLLFILSLHQNTSNLGEIWIFAASKKSFKH